MASSSTILEELKNRVNDELKAVTYAWLARKYSIPANAAKQLLFVFSEQNADSISTTYYLSGLKKGTGACCGQLVASSNLQQHKTEFERLDSMHVYSVQPRIAVQDSSALWNADLEQRETFFSKFLAASNSSDESGLPDRAVSAVRCEEAKWTATPGPRQPLKPVKNTQPPTAAGAERASGGTAAAATTGGASSPPPSQPAAQAGAQAAAPAAAGAQGPSPGNKRAAGKGKKGGLAGLWSNAVAKKGKQEAAAKEKEAAQEASKEADVEAEPMDEDVQDITEEKEKEKEKAAGKGKKRRVLMDESDDEKSDDDLKALGTKKGPTKGSSADASEKGKGKAATKGAAPKKAAASKQAAAAGPSTVQQAQPAAKAGEVQKKRRKVVKVQYNDKGEEETVIEWIEEEETVPAAEAAPAPAAAPAKAAPKEAAKPKKAAGKGKAAAGSQRITSFFTKK